MPPENRPDPEHRRAAHLHSHAIFNHPNFGVPNETAFNAGSFTTNFAATPNATAGQITDIIGNARQTQFSLKLIF